MLTEEEILFCLDNYKNGYSTTFVQLGHPYVFPIDSRINVFRSDKDEWALAIEVLGYNPRSEPIALEITYYGNCLVNLDRGDDCYSNSYCVLPIDQDSFDRTIEFETLKPDAEYWIVRGQKITLSHSKKEYEEAGITLKEYEPNEISAEEVGRLLVTKNRDLFRATNEELYKSIPQNLEKIMVIDEWYHRDFYQNDFNLTEHLPVSFPTLEQLQEAFKTNGFESKMSEDSFLNAFDFKEHDKKRVEHNDAEWNSNRPSSYETWQQIAKVLVTGDIKLYKPTLLPNSHWKNWPDAGTL